MIDSGGEGYLWRLEGVVGGKVDGQEEHTALRGMKQVWVKHMELNNLRKKLKLVDTVMIWVEIHQTNIQ